jgi:hypothetical protein
MSAGEGCFLNVLTRASTKPPRAPTIISSEARPKPTVSVTAAPTMTAPRQSAVLTMTSSNVIRPVSAGPAAGWLYIC